MPAAVLVTAAAGFPPAVVHALQAGKAAASVTQNTGAAASVTGTITVAASVS